MSQSCQHANQICDVRDQIFDRRGYHPPAASDQLRCFRLRCRPQNIPVAASCALLKEVHDVPAAVSECDALLPRRSTPSGQTITFNDRRSVSRSRLALSAADERVHGVVARAW
jgi:hypothetical protein